MFGRVLIASFKHLIYVSKVVYIYNITVYIKALLNIMNHHQRLFHNIQMKMFLSQI